MEVSRVAQHSMTALNPHPQSLLSPGQRKPYLPFDINPADPTTVLKYAVKPPIITLSDIAVGILAHRVDDPLVKAARRTWMAAAPRLAVLLLLDCECPTSTCPDLSRKQPLPACFSRQTITVQATVACYYGLPPNNSNHADKTQVLWNELLKLPLRKYYLKMDTDTMLEPSLMLRNINVLHAEAVSRMPDPTMVYFGKYEHRSPLRFGSLSRETWYRNFAANLTSKLAVNISWSFAANVTVNATHKVDELNGLPLVSTDAPRSFALPYVQGGLIGVSLKVLQMVVQSQCVHRLGYSVYQTRILRHFQSEDLSLGICMHIFGARMISSKCVQMKIPCRCDVGNAARRRLNCREDLWNATNCLVGSVSMHKLKKAEQYDQCWSWQQEALLNQRDFLLRPYTHPYLLNPQTR